MTDAARTRADRIATILWQILALNLAVAAAKLIYGLRSGAIAITADGLHSLLDGSSNVIGLIGIAVARRPPDANHPYGHRKYEAFAALGIAAMLFYGCAEIAESLIGRLRAPRVPEITAAGFVVIGVTIAINLYVVWIERRAARRLQSELLHADAAHTASDVMASVLVLASFVAARAGIAWADVIAAVVILALILRAGFQVLRTTLPTLSDERRIPPVEVEATALEEPGVLEVHNVRTRGAADDIHLDLHVLVQPDLSVARAHEIGHRVSDRLRGRWPSVSDVVVHVEPALEQERARRREGGGLRAEG